MVNFGRGSAAETQARFLTTKMFQAQPLKPATHHNCNHKETKESAYLVTVPVRTSSDEGVLSARHISGATAYVTWKQHLNRHLTSSAMP